MNRSDPKFVVGHFRVQHGEGIIDAIDNWVVDMWKDIGRLPNDNEWNRLVYGPLDGLIRMNLALQWRYNFGSLLDAISKPVLWTIALTSELGTAVLLHSNCDFQRSSPVKIGVIGLGRFGRLHSLTIQGLAEAELVGVVARRQASVEALQKELPEVPGWTDLDLAIRESGAEAWVVACSTTDHVPVTKKLLEAGKIVLLEKPVANTLADAESLKPFVKPDGSNLMMGHILLFNTEYRVLSEEVRRRGNLSFIDCVKHRPASIVTQFAGENPLIATMVHDLYAVQMLLDSVEPVYFSAQYHRTKAGAIDLALAQLKWPDGVVASFAAGYLSTPGMAPRGFDRMEVFGERWSARINPNPRPVEVWDEKAHWPMPLEIWTGPHGATGMLAEELRCFCRVVRGVHPVPTGATYFDALQVQRWMERLDACAK